MASELVDEDWTPAFYVGQHESDRTYAISGHVLDQANSCNVGRHP